jgi:hypothetical protein
MVSKRFLGVLAGLLTVGSACTPEQAKDDVNTTVAPATLSRTSTGWRIEVAPFKVPAGREVQRCVVVAGIPEEGLVGVSRVVQRTGGHHLALYTSPSAVPGRTYDCTAASTMATARFISPGAFDGTEENLAYRIKANAPFIIQSHYINATTSEMTVNDVFEADLLPAGSTPRLVDFMALVDTDFIIPTGRHSVTRTCNFARDIQLLRHFGHMHELGSRYTLEQVTNGTPVVLDRYDWEIDYRDAAPLNDFPLVAPLVVRAGEQLRITCEWNNTRDHEVQFPEEMCVTFMHYVVDSNYPGGFMTCTDSEPEIVL